MTLVRAVLRYRYKFIDCAAGAVPNNRHDLDLLSDDDCRRARGQLVMTRPKSRLRRDKSRPVVSGAGGSGRFCDPPLACFGIVSGRVLGHLDPQMFALALLESPGTPGAFFCSQFAPNRRQAPAGD
jgi:hypothetical protein